MRATPDWESEPDAVSLAAFRRSNRGAPQVLIVSSSDESGPALASRLGYDDCKTGPQRRAAARRMQGLNADKCRA